MMQQVSQTTTVSDKQGFLTDADGAKSSKRLWGSILLTSGILMGFILFAYGIIKESASFPASMEVMQMFIISGSGLLGLGIFENFKNVFNKTQVTTNENQ